MSKKVNLGSKLALYPMPVTVIGVMDGDRPNWLQLDHVGIVSHSKILVSMFNPHVSTPLVRKSGKFSINIIDRNLLEKADYVGSVSAAKADKSGVFDYSIGEAGTPIIEDAPLTIECEVVDIYEIDNFTNFICSISNTYCADNMLDESGKIDYGKLKPVLFEFPTYSYLATGEVIGKCTKMH